jgi:hypothetical protein
VVVEGPITQTKWSHIPITFSATDVNLTSFPHTDVMVITIHINQWDFQKSLLTTAIKQKYSSYRPSSKVGYDKKQLKEPTKPLYGFARKKIEPNGVITLPVSFGTPKNPTWNT